MNFEDLKKENKKREIENNLIFNMLNMIAKETGDHKAKLLALSIEISKKDKTIMDYFIDNASEDKEKINKAINFYAQINQLYTDLEKELNI